MTTVSPRPRMHSNRHQARDSGRCSIARRFIAVRATSLRARVYAGLRAWTGVSAQVGSLCLCAKSSPLPLPPHPQRDWGTLSHRESASPRTRPDSSAPVALAHTPHTAISPAGRTAKSISARPHAPSPTKPTDRPVHCPLALLLFLCFVLVSCSMCFVPVPVRDWGSPR